MTESMCDSESQKSCAAASYAECQKCAADVPKGCAIEVHPNNWQLDWATRIEGSQVGLDGQHNGESSLIRWAHDTARKR